MCEGVRGCVKVCVGCVKVSRGATGGVRVPAAIIWLLRFFLKNPPIP